MCGVNHENICTQPAEANSRRNERLFEEVGVDFASTGAQFYERQRGTKSDVAKRHFDLFI
jgi:hypothetical protein